MRVSRRGLMVAAGAATAVAALPVRAVAPGFVLVPRPTRVFKTKDRSHENTESWIVSLIVQAAANTPLTPDSIEVVLKKGGTVLSSTRADGAGFAAMTYRTGFPPTLADGSKSPAPIFWPFVVRLRQTVPIGMGVDAMTVRVTARDAGGAASSATLDVPVETYVQKTPLIFPFHGKGIVLQAGATNGGHRNRSGMFAIDAMGLDNAWSVQSDSDGTKPTDYPGFGRPLIAPAAGTVVRARSDRPDQPVGNESNPEFFAPEYRAAGGGDPGNHLVIDHGQGEFSMIAHIKAGTLRVKAGDRVSPGDVLGQLGQSGDTNAPHVHYQLQAGPEWENADALPCAFTNVAEAILDRGTYFEAK